MTTKKEAFVFCVDSDGCAMDTMTYKHQLFFGPIAAEVFGVTN
ncbi:phosphoglycolate phosphatase [Streptococcus pyogenes]|nr:phosphoglycolate phosphatase [Streptococcus pyogenes]